MSKSHYEVRKESSGAGIECEMIVVVLDVKIPNASSSVLIPPSSFASFLRCNHVELGLGSRRPFRTPAFCDPSSTPALPRSPADDSRASRTPPPPAAAAWLSS
ncbi:hypothetical protein R3P38DRAFT_3238680 [Favolaschia claudopus]|uniref:Uncharacterized protein n=1 Tax=Favolaschia claudopus TaxID=2862362 RepID=A0AAV9Z9E4_9AGAR